MSYGLLKWVVVGMQRPAQTLIDRVLHECRSQQRDDPGQTAGSSRYSRNRRSSMGAVLAKKITFAQRSNANNYSNCDRFYFATSFFKVIVRLCSPFEFFTV